MVPPAAVALEDTLPPPPDEEGETAAPDAGDEDGLDALEPRAGTGRHASPMDLSSTRRFPLTPTGPRRPRPCWPTR